MRSTSLCSGILPLVLLLAPAAAPAQSTVSISATPSVLSFSVLTGGALPAEQKVQIKRTGSGAALDFAVSLPATAPWLIVTPMAGKTGTPIGVRVNPTSLLAGTYTANVDISAGGASAPVTLAVTLIIRTPPPTPSVLPASLIFNYQTDQAAPVAQTFAVSSNGEPISFTAAVTGGTWLTVAPALGITVTGAPVVVTVSVDPTGVVPGNYSGKVTLAFSNASTKSVVVPVALVVSPGKAAVDSIWPNSAPIGSNDATVTMRGHHFFQKSTVQAGAVPLAATWISSTVMLVLLPKSLLAAAGGLSITVTNSPQPPSAPVVFTITPPGPVVQTVVNAASFAPAPVPAIISPGEMISIFGSGLGPSVLVPAIPSATAYPVTAGTPATTVEFELSTGVWTAAPIIFAQANQVNAVAPFAMAPGAGKSMRVTYNGLVSDPFVFDAVDADPGLFTTDTSGRGQAAALNYDDTTKTLSLNSASNPAPRGSIVMLFATGGGATTPIPSQEGQIVPVTPNPPTLNNAVSVAIGGDGATVMSAMSVPGSLAGLVQLVVEVPSTVKAAKDLPVVLTIAGHSSPATATLSVK